ncbi:MAG TPA: stage V sporulation protein K [Bacillota bacterium]|nr:stage V sporulation protein K [Bacillota bacterium]
MNTQSMQLKKGQINIVLHERQSIEARNDINICRGKNNPFSLIDEELASFVGMEKLKQTIREIYATIVINQKRKESGLRCTKQVLHMLFKGNPGTGKTTIARKLAKLYYDMNLLSKGHFIEAERADLVGEYIGQTAQKTRSMIQKSMGGILFVDEAYSLARGGDKDFGKEAIDTLVKHMEDYHNDFVLILAGYPREMERFLSLNPGLHSRFPFILEFPDYEVDELMDIARQMASEREYQLTKDAEWKLQDYLYKRREKTYDNFSNARYIRNVIERAVRTHAIRLLYKNKLSEKDLISITSHDLVFNEMGPL